MSPETGINFQFVTTPFLQQSIDQSTLIYPRALNFNLYM